MHKWMTFLVAGIFLVGCSGAQEREDCERLDWLDKVPMNCAVGVAQNSSISIARTMAVQDGMRRAASAERQALKWLIGGRVEEILPPADTEGSEPFQFGDGIVYEIREYFLDCTGNFYVLVCFSERELLIEAERVAREVLEFRPELLDDAIKHIRERFERAFGN